MTDLVLDPDGSAVRHEAACYEAIGAGDVARTVSVRSDLLMDLDSDGHVVGVERLGNDDVTALDLQDVIRDLRYTDMEPPR